MPSTYTTNLGIEKIATGEQSGTWGNTTNTNLDILDQSIDGIISITLASAGSSGSPNSLPITDGAVSNGRNKFIEFVDGGDLGATAYVQLTPNDSEKIVHIRNSLSASRSIIVFQGTYSASNDYEILNGEDVLLKFDGAGAGAVVSQVFANLALPSVNIDGGTIDGAVIGGATAASGSFTTLSAADGSASSPSVTNTGDTNTGIFFPAADTVGVAVGGTEVWRYGSNPTTAKNLIINGESSVNQRGTQTGLGAAGAYLNDRWKYEGSGSGETGRFTASKGTGITGAAGSQRIEVTTADAVLAAGHIYLVTQKIEAQNLLHLLYGTASAKSLTYQAVFKTDVAGDYTLKFLAPDGSRTYVTTITLVGDESQEAFTFTLPGDTSGTIGNDTGVGLEVMLTLAAGSNFQGGTEDAWTAEANNTYGAANTVNFFATVGNYIEFSLCQLEVGSVATDFEHEDYGTTLEKCYRYFQAIYIDNNVGYAAEASSSTSAYTAMIPYLSYNWRATPSASIRTNPNMRYRSYLSGFISATTSSTAGTGAFPYAPGFYISCSGTLSGVTDGMPGLLNATGTMLVDFSAEL